MAILDEMVLHCCGDCRNGYGTSFIDYTLDGNNNPSTEKHRGRHEDIYRL